MKKKGDVRVLLVEDNPGDVRLVLEAFKEINMKFRITVAQDGEEAIAALKAEENGGADIILLDLKIPKKSGFEVLDEVRRDEKYAGIPVIIMSSSRLKKDIEEAYRLKANFYITKESGIEEYVEIAKYIESFWMSSANPPPAV